MDTALAILQNPGVGLAAGAFVVLAGWAVSTQCGRGTKVVDAPEEIGSAKKRQTSDRKRKNTSPRSADGVASDASGSALSALPQEQPHKAKLSYAAAAAAGSAAAAAPASAPAKPSAAPAAARKPQAQQSASGPASSPGAASAASQRSAAAPKNGAGAVASAPAKTAPAPAALGAGAGAAPVSSSSKKASKAAAAAAAAAAPAPKKKAAAAAALAPPPRGITGAGPASLGGFTSTSDAATDAAIAAALSGDEQGVDDGWEVVSAKKPRAKAAAAAEGGELSE